MRPMISLAQRILGRPRFTLETSFTLVPEHLHRLSQRSLWSSPFHRLFARHAYRQRIRGLLQSNKRWYTQPAKHASNSSSIPKASQSTGSSASSSASSSEASLSLTARLRKLSREYGWSVFGVYMALTALDFPFCFLAVRWFGTERIGHWEHVAVQWIKRAIPFQWPEKWGGHQKEPEAKPSVDGAMLVYDHGVREAEAANSSESASIWTQLALAYAIHKSFIFVRVPLTAAITPKVVRVLRGWGWNIGKIKPKAERVAARAERKASKAHKDMQI